MGLSQNVWLFIGSVTLAYLIGLATAFKTMEKPEKLNVLQKGARVRYRGSKDGEWKFGVIEEDIIGDKIVLAILRGVDIQIDELDRLVVKNTSRIFPIRREKFEIVGHDDVWLKKDLI